MKKHKLTVEISTALWRASTRHVNEIRTSDDPIIRTNLGGVIVEARPSIKALIEKALLENPEILRLYMDEGYTFKDDDSSGDVERE